MLNIKKSLTFIVIVLFVGVFFLWDSFSLRNITYDGEVENVPPLSLDEKEQTKVDAILNQPFTYLGKGHQSYAFISGDGQYVLKFFKFTYLRPSWFIRETTRQKKLKRMFIGYHLAYTYDRDNTGMVFVHLSKSTNLMKTLTVADQFGIHHSVNLDHVFFVIQQKAIMTKKVLKDLLNQGDLEAFKLRLDQLIALYLSEYSRGLFDGDHNILSNTGFLPDQAIRIDVGRLALRQEFKNPDIYGKDLRKILSKRIDRWIKSGYPQYYHELHQAIESKLAGAGI